MIAGCPKCGARYRVEREKLAAGGVRLRCAKCEAVFRVRAPDAEAADANERTQLHVEPSAPKPASAPAPRTVAQAPKPAPVPASPPASGDLVLIAIPEPDIAKALADALSDRGARCIVVHDGVEAVLELQRNLPKAAVVAAHLPKMFGFQICELVKRNESLRGTWLILIGAIHNQDRYRRPALETYGADAYLEMPDLPDGALPLLERGGVALRAPSQAAAALRLAARAPETAPPVPAPTRTPAPVSAPRVAAAPPPVVAGQDAQPAPRARVADGLDEQRAKAERLARIIVSDIVLYNEAKFAEAIRRGNVAEALDADLVEGRHLFQERIDARVRAERDYLVDELVRVAKQRGMK
jgi:predicted Zn finger-like uncharacterized protein